MDAAGLGREIKSRRRALGLTQAALAARAGVSQQHLSLIEADPGRAELRTLLRIVSRLGLGFELVAPAQAAFARRQAAWRRLNEDETPVWSTPAADLRRVGEMAELFARRHGPRASPPAAEERGAWRAARERLARVFAR